MNVNYSKKAEKQFLKLPKSQQQKILKRTKILKNNPFSDKKLKGKFKGLLSLKTWPYRIIYQINKKAKTLFIITIDHRQQAYK